METIIEIYQHINDRDWVKANYIKLWKIALLLQLDKLPKTRDIHYKGTKVNRPVEIIDQLSNNFDDFNIELKWSNQYLYHCCRPLTQYQVDSEGYQMINFIAYDDISSPDDTAYNILLISENKLPVLYPKAIRQLKLTYQEIWTLTDLKLILAPLIWLASKSDQLEKYLSELDLSQDQPSEILFLRFHQRLLVNEALEQLATQHKLLFGCVPRSGKSIMMAGLIADYSPNRVIIILGRKSETLSQFADIFKSYQQLKDYVVRINNLYPNDQSQEKLVYLVSQQKLKTNDKKSTFLEQIQQVFHPDHQTLIFLDEAHFGVSSARSEAMLLSTGLLVYDDDAKQGDKLTCHPNHRLILVTGTYGKPILRFALSDKRNMLLWDYADMLEMGRTDARNPFGQIKRKYPHLSKSIDNLREEYFKIGLDLLTIAKPYQEFPILTCIVPSLVSMEKAVETSTIRQMLQIKNSKGNKYQEIFQHPKAVVQLLDWIKELYNHKSIVHLTDGRREPHTQMWFLPTTTSSEISECDIDTGRRISRKIIEPLTRGLLDCLLDDPDYRDDYCFLVVHRQKFDDDVTIKTFSYKRQLEDLSVQQFESNQEDDSEESEPIYCYTTKCTGNTEDVRRCILQQEYQARLRGRSLIILTGSMLRMGISLPCVELGINMDPVESFENQYQTMFRVLTESEDKSNAFYIDLISDRFLQFVFDYATQATNDKDSIDSLENNIKSVLKIFNVNDYQMLVSSDEKLSLYQKLIEQIIGNFDQYQKELRQQSKQQLKISLLDLDISDKDIDILTGYQGHMLTKSSSKKGQIQQRM